MEVLEGIFIFLISIWIVSFLYNCFYFFKHDDSDIDTVFINLTKTFEEAHQKLNILEIHVERSLERPRKKLKFPGGNFFLGKFLERSDRFFFFPMKSMRAKHAEAMC